MNYQSKGKNEIDQTNRWKRILEVINNIDQCNFSIFTMEITLNTRDSKANRLSCPNLEYS